MQMSRFQLRCSLLSAVTACMFAWAVYVGLFFSTVSAGSTTTSGSAAASGSDDKLSVLCNSVMQATVRIETASDRFSGVLVSKAGFIFTVAHGLKSTDLVANVIWFDGSVSKASVVLRDTNRDLAVLQLQQLSQKQLPEALPFANEISGRVTIDAMVLAAGCPGREDNAARAVLRIGKVVAASRNTIRTTCALTVGDSGGPLVNQHGQIVGLNARIGLGASANQHLPAGLIRAACQQKQSLKSLFAGSNVATSDVELPPTAATVVTDALRQMTVTIYSGDEALCLGTIVNSGTIVSKLSELQYRNDLSCQLADQTPIGLTLNTADQPTDLAVLKTTDSNVTLPSRSDGFSEDRHSEDISVKAGSLVYAGTEGMVAIVGRTNYTEPRDAAKLGCILSITDEMSLQIDEVSADSAAMDAGLKSGDQLISANGSLILDFDDLAKLLTHCQPGDQLKFAIRRSGRNIECVGRLRSSPENLLERTEFADGRGGEVSRRRAGFASVLQHDAALTPQQMGGPLVNAAGQLVAINIARRSRESVLAVPVSQVLNRVNATDAGP